MQKNARARETKKIQDIKESKKYVAISCRNNKLVATTFINVHTKTERKGEREREKKSEKGTKDTYSYIIP